MQGSEKDKRKDAYEKEEKAKRVCISFSLAAYLVEIPLFFHVLRLLSSQPQLLC